VWSCIVAFSATDVRDDLKKIDVPTLNVHADADRVVPIAIAGKKSQVVDTTVTMLVRRHWRILQQRCTFSSRQDGKRLQRRTGVG